MEVSLFILGDKSIALEDKIIRTNCIKERNQGRATCNCVGDMAFPDNHIEFLTLNIDVSLTKFDL